MKDLNELLATVSQLFDQANHTAAPAGLYDPIEYTMHLGGKRLRPALLMAACEMFGGEAEQAANAAMGIEMFHNYTLLHDDLMDQSPLRRGKPTVYRKWNSNTAILSGDTMFALAWRYMLQSRCQRLSEVLSCFCNTAIEVVEGQQLDMDFERTAKVPIADYMEMIRLKTAVLLACALKVGALHTNASAADVERLYGVGIHCGLAFQLQDDLLDVYGDVAVFGKQTGQDIIDRKKTYMVLRAMELLPPDEAASLETMYAEPCIDAAGKVARVKEVYDRLDLRTVVAEAVDREFEIATAELDAIAVPESNKSTMRELVKSLVGRKK
ncbi:MAG: polyprenyl synthetase family protein [Bacteroidales bacterium]|nr:polyprenyl synthetase family protein [Bacteroidales bacterium]